MLFVEKLSTNSVPEKAGNINVFLWWRSNLGNSGRSFVLPIATPHAFGVSEQQIYIASLLIIFGVQKLETLTTKGF